MQNKNNDIRIQLTQTLKGQKKSLRLNPISQTFFIIIKTTGLSILGPFELNLD